MNRGELETLIAQYIHRDDLGPNIPGFIDLATSRIARDLRSAENETVLDPYEPTTQISDLPDDFQSIRDISWGTGAGRVALKASSPAQMGIYPQTGSSPVFYRVIGKQIEITPFQAKEFRLVYFNAPADLVDDASENKILTAYPAIYLYASLIEAYFFTQDAGGHGLASETYSSEVAIENTRTTKADSGDRPSITGAN
jgi:hypothetical protein